MKERSKPDAAIIHDITEGFERRGVIEQADIEKWYFEKVNHITPAA
jgi:hypothetical protein